MHLVTGDELPQVSAQSVVWVGGNVVELVHGDQPIIEGCHAKLVHREAEGGMGADQHLVIALQEGSHGIDLAAIVGARRITQIPAWLHVPIGPEAISAKWFVVEARSNRLFRHHDDGLLDALVGQFVQGDEHQGAAFTGCRR
ncbi:hypothetical protein D3C81_1210240 [compost metagenome]